MIKRTFTLLFFIGLFQALSFAQSDNEKTWTFQEKRTSDKDKIRISTSNYDLYELDMSALQSQLSQTMLRQQVQSKDDLIEIEIPTPGQQFERFAMFEAPVMEVALQAKYPEIRTYTGQGIDNPRHTIKMDVGPGGFHAMVFSNKETYAIEPAFDDEPSRYMVFQKKDVQKNESDSFICGVSETAVTSLTGSGEDDDLAFAPTGPELRTYRLALATTGEYSSFHGGTKPLVLAAMATVMNRVNGIYEKDLTVTMVMISNTDTLIYLNGSTDPYTNNDGGTMLDENNDNINAIIGPENYDIGHVFSTGGGGIAGLGVVCGGNKAWGVTGLNAPINDVFSVDYVAHEMGHQFSGNHTFNSCGNQGPQPYEPGSGVTVMAYAGICGTTNIANNSIDQFHVASFDEIIEFSHNGGGNDCAAISPTNNTPPSVDAGEGGFYIPYRTPFELTGSATDIEGDSLTYCWEQFDLGPNTPPNVAVGSAPLFRSYKPVDHPTRIFPNINAIVTNTNTFGELLPQFGREMNFRMTVRDNVAGGGGVDYDQITFQVADDAGPFLVTAPNGGQNWTVGSLQNISWNVANTDITPVNCTEVDIYFSQDGGYTYPHLVASNLPNTGSAIIQVPNIVGTQIRAKVKGSDNIFFDISNQNFTIIEATEPNFVFISNTEEQTICGEEAVTYEVMIDTVLGYNDPINLSIMDNPLGTTFTFSDNDVVPPNMVTISATADNSVSIGNYDVTILLTGSTGTQELPLVLKVRDGAPIATTLISPENGATGIQGNIQFSWNPVPAADSYTVEVSTSPQFSNLVSTGSVTSGTTFSSNVGLDNNTIYFWRVRAVGEGCGPGEWSSIATFQTMLSSCSTYVFDEVPLDIPNQGTVMADIEVTSDFEITDVNITDLTGDHNRVGQLSVVLVSPIGNLAVLFDGICGNDNDFDLGFDDDGISTGIPCPPVTGLTYQAEDDLSSFNGTSSLGTWSLAISDSSPPASGDLLSWSLELCGPEPSTDQPNFDLNGAEVLLGETLDVISDNIMGDCGGSTDNLSYMITGLPTNGILLLDGNAVDVGTSFTQSDIDGGLFTYVNDGVDLDPDQFEFILSCEDGLYLGGLVMDISVVTSINTDDLVKVDFIISPNPVADYFELQMGQTNRSGSYSLAIVDMLGRTIYEQNMLARTTRVETKSLSSGVYSCQLKLDDVVVGEEKLVVVK